MENMKISILTDNHPGARTMSEHGLSYLIEYDKKKLLFDVGQSDLFLRNAAIMNISLADIDLTVLSHGHFDHGDGLWNLSGGSLLCHPGCFVKRYRKSDKIFIGLKNTRSKLAEKFALITSSEPYKITEKIIFLGEIPRLTDFESRDTSFMFDDGLPDFVMDDSALAMLCDEGIFVVTGCGHAGIVNTLEYAKNITGEKRIKGIMGGFHLKENNRQTKETIRYLNGNNVKHVIPSHCTALPALSAFYENFRFKQVRTGDVFIF